jgi:hypothetical protein
MRAHSLSERPVWNVFLMRGRYLTTTTTQHPLFGPFDRDCPKRGMSNASTVDLVGIRRPKWAEKHPFGDP